MSKNNGLPKGWTLTPLNQVADVNPSKVVPDVEADAPFNFVPMASVMEEFGGIDVSTLRPFSEVKKGYTQFQSGDVLVAKITPCMENGKITIVPELKQVCGYGSTEFHVLRPRGDVDAKWIAHFVSRHTFRRDARRNMSGSAGQLRVPTKWLDEQLLPIAPPDEQRRIVAKIEELFSDLDAGVAALERAKANLKRYRAAALKAAVEGKLTEQWRADHPDTEPAQALLARILTERRQRWEQDQLARYKAKGKQPPKGWKDKYKEPAKLDTSELPKLPKGWCWATLDAIADITGGITKDKKRANQAGMREVPYLRVANVQRGYLDLSEMKDIWASDQDVADLRLQHGDVLFTEGGDRDKLGRGWVWSGELAECIHQNHIFRARLFGDDMQPRLVSHHGNTFGREWFTRAGKQTTNLASINLGMLRQFPVPIPSAGEQKEIVNATAERLSQIDAAEIAIGHSLRRATLLRQSILKQAFEGRLVSSSLPLDTDVPSQYLFSDFALSREDTRKVTHKKHSKGINFRRAAILCYSIDALHKSSHFGRVQAMKILYLAEAWLGQNLELEPRRQAAGPLDYAIYKIESLARKQGWYTVSKAGPVCRYTPGAAIGGRIAAAHTILGDKQADMDRLLKWFSKMDTDKAELFATTFAVWNDLLIERMEPSEQAVVDGVHAWHKSKHRYHDGRILKCIDWMKEKGCVPRGIGPHTAAIFDA